MSDAKTTLVVDDEPGLRDVLSFYLEDAGYRVLTAAGGYEALRILDSHAVDAVVSDIRMPLGSGMELLDGIQARVVPKPVVLLVTAFSDISMEEAFERGAEAVLSKPVKPDALLSSLQRALAAIDDRWRRHSSRLPTSLGIQIRSKDTGLLFVARAFNIGRGGAFVALDLGKSPAVGTFLEFRLEGPEGLAKGIAGEGVVRWVRQDATGGELLPRGFGMEFTALSDASRVGMVNLINSIKIGAYIPKA